MLYFCRQNNNNFIRSFKKQTELKEYYVDLQRHIFRLCLTDFAWSGGMARKW